MPLKIILAPGEQTELTDDCLVKMGEVTLHTKKAERAFALCYREGKVVPSREHIGGRFSISYKDCPGGMPKAGTFHTHPSSDSQPSWGDGYSYLANSERNLVRWLGCVGSPRDQMVRCLVPRGIPTREELQKFRRRYAKYAYQPLSSDPELDALIKPVAAFGVRDIPQMLKKVEVPVPAVPRIKTEELVFAGSMFKRYTNLDTGEERIERVY